MYDNVLEEIHQASEVNIYLKVFKTQPRKVLMMLTASITVSHLYQNVKIVSGVRNLKQASEGVNYCDKRGQSRFSSFDKGGQDHKDFSWLWFENI